MIRVSCLYDLSWYLTSCVCVCVTYVTSINICISVHLCGCSCPFILTTGFTLHRMVVIPGRWALGHGGFAGCRAARPGLRAEVASSAGRCDTDAAKIYKDITKTYQIYPKLSRTPEIGWNLDHEKLEAAYSVGLGVPKVLPACPMDSGKWWWAQATFVPTLRGNVTWDSHYLDRGLPATQWAEFVDDQVSWHIPSISIISYEIESDSSSAMLICPTVIARDC